MNAPLAEWLRRFNRALLMATCLGSVFWGHAANTANAETDAARRVRDMTGFEVRIASSPERIVTLAPSLGETAAALIAHDESKDGNTKRPRLVGVSERTDFPAELKKPPPAGPDTRVQLEKLGSLKPDLVFATTDGNSSDQVRSMRRLGIPVFVVSTHTLDQIRESFGMMAQAMGMPDAGQKLLSEFDRDLSAHGSTKEMKSPEVVLQVGVEPLVVVGSRSFLHEALVKIGGKNAYGDSNQAFPRPSIEDVVSREPDLLILLDTGEMGSRAPALTRRWKELGLRARVVQSDELLRPTPRLAQGLRKLSEVIHEK